MPKRYLARVAAILALLVASCATVEKLHKDYPGYTVVDKQVTPHTQSVPITKQLWVAPNGAILCEEDSGSLGCAVSLPMQYNKKQLRQIKQVSVETGQYRQEQYNVYHLLLKGPDGSQKKVQVSELQFNGVLIGQKLGQQPAVASVGAAALPSPVTDPAPWPAGPWPPGSWFDKAPP